MTAASSGQEVEIHLRGTLPDGTEFLSTYDSGPIHFRLGDGSVIRGLDVAIHGMTAGQKKQIMLKPENAFGFRNEKLVFKVPKERLDEEVTVGDEVVFQEEPQDEMAFRVVEIGNQHAVLDGNHPLAGQTVQFDIELVSLTFQR